MTNLASRSCSGGADAFAALLRAAYGNPGRGVPWQDAYPAVAGVAASADLGFSTGPWVSAADGVSSYGHFLSIWTRDEACHWQRAHESTIVHREPAIADPKLSPESAWVPPVAEPPAQLIAADAFDRAVEDFQVTAIEDGFDSGLRTYARNYDFGFLVDGELPMQLDGAVQYLGHHEFRGEWQESSRARSGDSTFLYGAGMLEDVKHHAARPYVQLWQFDPKVVNWGLRILFLGAGS